LTKTTVAVYYFPNYHEDPRNAHQHGPGWTEWELVRRAEPRFPGHRQPRIPAWGEQDEADPKVMAEKITAAADHGVDVFFFDWYYYDDGPFLERALDEGFLDASNVDRMKFALMWANHDWRDIHPAKLRHGDVAPHVLYPGKVTPATFDRITDLVIERYFRHPSYWLVDGKPYLSIYEIGRLQACFGGIEATREALDRFRDKVRNAGFIGLHLNAVIWDVRVLPGETSVADPNALLGALGFDSLTSYVWIHHVPLTTFPEMDYTAVCDRYMEFWDEAERTYTLPYFPNVTVGWDSSPRTVQSDGYGNVGYPFTPVLADSTPATFYQALRLVKERLDRRVGPQVVTVNAWNEWTEGSYLEPDTVHGMGFLEAIRDVFGDRSTRDEGDV
jgi:hypothetical protein